MALSRTVLIYLISKNLICNAVMGNWALNINLHHSSYGSS